MNIEDIPLVRYLGIERNQDGNLELPFQEQIGSYFQTQHAGAQFTLAESASIDFLQHSFPELVGKTIPIFRGSETKFKKMSNETIIALASIEESVKEKFLEQLEKKRRATITIDIKLIDSSDILTFEGKFTWFVQMSQEN